MEYQVGTIRQSNIQAHDDIETDILTQKDGLFTFVLRINGGNIVDYNMVEYVDVREVLDNEFTRKELSFSRNFGERSRENPVWNNNGERKT